MFKYLTNVGVFGLILMSTSSSFAGRISISTEIKNGLRTKICINFRCEVFEGAMVNLNESANKNYILEVEYFRTKTTKLYDWNKKAFIEVDEAVAAESESSENAALIYEALIVKAIDITPTGTYGGLEMERSVGGLKCQERSVVGPNANPKYSCSLSANKDNKAIYDALDITEVSVVPEGVYGSSDLVREVGNLVCHKRAVVSPNAEPKYSCSLN